MRQFFMISVFALAFLVNGCEMNLADDDRANWDPTPVITDVQVVDSEKEPKAQITMDEWWADLKITGNTFGDSYGHVNLINAFKDDVNALPCSIIYVSPYEIKCTLDGWDFYSWAGPGTYFVKVKTSKSEWSNAFPVTVY